MAHKWDESQRDDSSSDPEQDFESFLRRKVEECTQDKPASLLTPTTPDAAPDVVADSESPTSELIRAENPQSGLPPASAADVKVTELEVREHPIAGPHVVEHSVVLTVDSEWVRISNESYTMAVVDLSCEKIIERIHDLNRLRFLIPAQQFGLQNALEELLKSRNAEDRAKLTALMSENYRKLKARTTPTTKAPRAPREKKVGSGAASAASGKGAKTAKQFHVLGFDREFTETKLKEQGLFDEATAKYVEKLYS
jgi:hypothetical protein